MNDSILLIFTKYPQLGKCKTRLAKSIGEEKALRVYEHLLDKTASVIPEIEADTAVFFDEEIHHHKRWKESHYQKLQAEGDLGLKMKEAFRWAFEMKYTKICIIGSDLWDIEAPLIQNAFEALDNSEVVVGPAQDGGYYLFGSRSFIPEAFELSEWSTSHVFRETLVKLEGKKIHLFPEKNDIDTVEDLKRIPFFEDYVC